MKYPIWLACLLLGYTALQAQLNFIQITGPFATTGDSKNGAAWVDYDNDGDLDLYLSQAAEANLMFENDGAGNLTQVTTVMDLVFFPSMGSAWGDYDNDGDLDVFMACQGANNKLFRRDGTTFSEIIVGNIVSDLGDSNHGTLVDFNNDGFLDVHVINRANEPNFLYKGNGDGTFVKITSGEIISNGGNLTVGVWADADLDGDQDVYVVNRDGVNYLYENNGDETFTRITTSGPGTSTSASRTASWGDYDNDGDPDLFVGNADGESDIVYENTGDFTFLAHPLGDVNSANASTWADFDNNGTLDLYVGNLIGTDDLYLNDGTNLVPFTSGPIGWATGDSDGVATGDIDGDGDLDLYVPSWFSDDNFFRNELIGSNNWLDVNLEGTISNRSAIGARIVATATIDGNSVMQTRFIAGQTGRHTHRSLTAHFGFGATSTVNDLAIYWPSGEVCMFTNVATNQVLNISEECATDSSTFIVALATKPLKLFPNPAATWITLQLPDGLGEEAVLQIRSTDGKLHYSESLSATTATISRNVAHLPAGIYQVVVETTSVRYAGSLVKSE